jgi:hypothetical protein
LRTKNFNFANQETKYFHKNYAATPLYIQDDAGGEDYSGKDPEAVDPGADYANEPPKSKEESASDSQTEKGDTIL